MKFDRYARSSESMVMLPVSRASLSEGLRESIHTRNRTSDVGAWGGFVGLTWMVSYWATLIPMWLNHVVGVFSPS